MTLLIQPLLVLFAHMRWGKFGFCFLPSPFQICVEQYEDSCLPVCSLVVVYWRYGDACCLHQGNDDAGKYHWNVDKILQDCTAPQSRRRLSSIERCSSAERVGGQKRHSVLHVDGRYKYEFMGSFFLTSQFQTTGSSSCLHVWYRSCPYIFERVRGILRRDAVQRTTLVFRAESTL